MEKSSIVKIAVIGAESSGKTWLCEALAKYYKTAWVPEYARAYFHDSDIYNYTLEDLIVIAKKQVELENELIKKANRFLFCDTTLITLKIWAILEFKHTPAYIEEQLKEVKYDHYFITDNQMPWVHDSLRQNKHSRDLLFQMNETEAKKTGIPYTVIEGEDNKRLTNAVKILDSKFKL
jgi:NadR type nicotinamide-nucleotide adenylyltransferase